jgi:heme exporter protein C
MHQADGRRPWGTPLLTVLTVLAVVAALYMAFIYAPREQEMGEVQRIFYFHVASAWLGMLAFLVVFIFSILYLWKGRQIHDRIAACSGEIGVVFTTIVLTTGPIWGKSAWGVWWTWDPRLTSALVMWIMYVAYLVLRASLPESRKKLQFSAVYAIVAFLDVPIVFFSIRWWRRGMHPPAIEMAPQMIHALIVACVAFTLLYFLLMRIRLNVQHLQDRLDDIRRTIIERE